MSGLAAFVRARLDEDEAAANALGPVEGHWAVVIPDSAAEPFLCSETRGRAYLSLPPPMLDYLRHFARHDPARVLREVEAKRAILAEHGITVEKREIAPFNPYTGERQPTEYDVTCAACGWASDDPTSACATLRALAAVYRDHPEYRAEWGL